MDGAFTISPLDMALELADTHGWYVHPVIVKPKPDGKSEKIYLINWKVEASNDPEKIEAMLTSKARKPAWQYATHVAVSCQPSGVWVVDEDAVGAADGLNLPETLIMSTRRGRHYVYQAADFDQRNTTSNPAKHVDIRANGGNFVVYGQVIHDAEIAPWPFDKIIVDQEKSQPGSKPNSENKGGKSYSKKVADLTIEGKRHDAVASISMTAANHAFPQDLIDALLSQVCDTYDDKARETVASAYKKARREGSDFRHVGINLIRDDKERPIWNVANAEALIIQHEDWRGVLGYNAFTRARVLLRPIPGQDATTPRDITDDDYTAAQAWFQRNGFPKADAANVIAAVRKVAGHNSYDPLTDYLSGLIWDRKPRITSWLVDYCGAELSEYTQEIGLRWMISAVARAFKPGCKADSMIVLEGAQGKRKSSALAALAGEDWFSDALPQMGTKDASSYLRGKWIIEVAELEAMRKDVDAIKAFISRQVEHYRPAYGREEVTEARRCVFAGSTNKDDWNRDETGGRRFWPVKVGEIEVDWIKRDRDQLWAEAVHHYRRGERWWLEGDVVKEAQTQVAERAADDPWRDDIRQALIGVNETTTKQVLAHMGVDIKDMTPALSKRVAKELVLLKWQRAGRVTGGAARYVRSEASEGKVRE